MRRGQLKRRKAIPTAKRTMAYLREAGWTVAKVELYNHFCRQRFDMFGFADLVAIRADRKGALAVQSAAMANEKDHIDKVRDNEILKMWLNCGNAFWLVCWGKRQVNGRPRWSSRVSVFSVHNGRLITE